MSAAPNNSNEIIEKQLDVKAAELESVTDSDVVAYIGPIWGDIESLIRTTVEQREERRKKLLFVLETPGGSIEVVQRIVDTLRHHYDSVEFVVPNYAMSAGTVLVMSGDAFYMDYFSVLGPIDPQVQKERGGKYVPALGYLVQYERLIEKSAKGKLTTAELAYLIEKFDPAELYLYEQARELSISLLKEWLIKYKFKNWTKTKTRGKRVTKAMRKMRATKIAKKLNETEHWHSHGRGISMEVLRKDLELVVEDFGGIPQMNTAIKSYYTLMGDYMNRRGHTIVAHTIGRYKGM